MSLTRLHAVFVWNRRAIDQEKVVYKESFDRLRVLKPEIEHIRKVRRAPCASPHCPCVFYASR
jgi:hypothetical protein